MHILDCSDCCCVLEFDDGDRHAQRRVCRTARLLAATRFLWLSVDWQPSHTTRTLLSMASSQCESSSFNMLIMLIVLQLALVLGAFIVAGVCYLFGAAFITHNFSLGSSVFETFVGTASVLTAIGVSAFALSAFYYFYIVYR